MIKVADIAYGRLRSPDLDAQEAFLTHFGMVRAGRTETALYMRGTDGEHHIHVTELGEPGFIGLAFNAASEADLERISGADGASEVEAIDEPGGGKRVRLAEPNGYQIEVVWGIDELPPLPLQRNIVNTGAERDRRVGELTRLQKGPSQVKRLGHAVIMTPRHAETVAWFRRTLGMIGSDDVYAGAEDNIIASFNRCDRGAEPVDHHTCMFLKSEKTGLNHLAYEVRDMDDVFMGHEHLAGVGDYEQVWGLGRHVLGAQVFDYWLDPWGRLHEHWTDIDLLDAAVPSNLLPAEEGLGSQWGDPAPERFVNHASR
ncbi:MAG: VOC family protein [Alphaproteobacteria bacterium]|jgi:catechol 2,3-dioxygenase-like lactoylglutathione lyase family enzyme|nr:VOC family protein [Alphaproteobacteria bacterium]